VGGLLGGLVSPSPAASPDAVEEREPLRRVGVLDGVHLSGQMLDALTEVAAQPVGLVAAGSGEAREVDCLVAAWQHELDEAVLIGFPSLRVILLRATSRARVDERALRARGIELVTLGRYGDESTAEFVVAEMLAHFRRSPGRHLPRELSGRTLGIIGMGVVGQRVARAALGLEMDVVYSARTADDAPRVPGTRPSTQDEVQSRADVLSVHTPPYVQVLSGAALERTPAELLVITTLGLPLPEEDLVQWVAAAGRSAVTDLCAAQDAAARLVECGVGVRPLFAARSDESIARAESQLLARLRAFLERRGDDASAA